MFESGALQRRFGAKRSRANDQQTSYPHGSHHTTGTFPPNHVNLLVPGGTQVVQLKVNGVAKQFDGDPEMPLLWYLRDLLELTGTKFGCGQGLCGACTVHVDGVATRSCLTSLQSAAGKTVLTIEGLSPAGMHPLQTAWKACAVPQCGYCQ